MRVVVAGATGALARALIPRLVGAGHEVIGLSRSAAARERLQRLGARLEVADILDVDTLNSVVGPLRPEVVVHAAKAIPKRGPRSFRDMRSTNRLHDEGSKNLVTAAVAAGATRFVAESIVFAYGYGDLGDAPLLESAPTPANVPHPKLREEIDGVLAMEEHTRAASAHLDGVILRFGLFYGPYAGTEQMTTMLRRHMMPLPGGGSGSWPLIYIEDAAEAAAVAVTAGRGGETYNIVDDESVPLREFVTTLARVAGTPRPWAIPAAISRLGAPYFTEVALTSMRVSNTKAKHELGWSPRHPTYREGLAAWAATTTTAAS